MFRGDQEYSERDADYRLYTICERLKWAQEAVGYNAIVLAWPDLPRLAEELNTAGPENLLLWQEHPTLKRPFPTGAC
jgi:hypothetical protein